MKPKINRSSTVYKNRVFTLMSENVTLTNGVTTDLDIVRHPGASAIIPYTDRNTVVLIHQYRHAVGGSIWEIPAGIRDLGETPEACAERELIEETGYAAARWQKMAEITPVPGYSDERIHIFLARDLTAAIQNLDRDEVLEVHEIDFNAALGMIMSGHIVDGKTITGLLLARQWLEENSV